MDGNRTGEAECHAALGELDRGFRSGKIGDRYQAVATLPEFLRTYPFPLFVNNAFLKVADLFKNGNNLLRMAIVRAVERSSQALEGVISKDEMGRRLIVVSHSNDPVARAVTLRLIGALAPIFAEMKQIHHLIGSSLDSRDGVELHAAIQAAQRFAEYSKEFARSIFEKITPLLVSPETSIARKQQFLFIVQHFGSDAVTAAKAFKFLETDLFPNCPSQGLLCLILNVLTRLSQHSVFILPNQVSLLLRAVKEDYDRNVKRIAVKNLRLLAISSAHLWSSGNVEDMMEVGLGEELRPSERKTGLEALVALTRSASAPLWLPNIAEEMVRKCLSVKDEDSELCLLRLELMIHVRGHESALGESWKELKEECRKVCTRLILSLLLSQKWDSDARFSKELLRVTRLFTAVEDSPRSVVAGLLMDQAKRLSSKVAGKAMLMTLLWIAERELSLGQQIGDWTAENIETASRYSVIITSKLIFRDDSLSSQSSKVDYLVGQIEKTSANGWHLLVFARSALQNGWPSAAVKLFQTISTLGLSQLCGNYVKGLLSISRAELVFHEGEGGCSAKEMSLCERLDQACRLYSQGQILLQMCRSSGDVNLPHFPIAFLRARLKMLKAARNFILIFNGIRTCPHLSPSADGSNQGKSQLISQISSAAKAFGDSVSTWKSLEAECFDADNDSLNFLRFQSSFAGLLQAALHATLGGKIQEKVLPGPVSTVKDELGSSLTLLHRIESDPGGITMKKLSLVRDAVTNMTRIPLRFPAFFFHSSQETRINLLLSPSPQNSGVFVAITGHQIVLKVEGVITHGGPRPKSLRSVSQVILTVKTEMDTPQADEGKSTTGSKVMTKKLQPINNYFSAEFLVVFHQPGKAIVETSLVDDQTERVWTTRATSSLRIAVVS